MAGHDGGGAGPGDGSSPDASGDTPDAGPTNVTTYVYVGGGDSKIHVYTLDRASLALSPHQTIDTGDGPSFLAFDKARVVAVNEGAGAVESFNYDALSGKLVRRDGASSQGAGPAHIAFDGTGTKVLVANYDGDSAAVIPISSTGQFGAATQVVFPGANAHQIVPDPANVYIYIPCLGDDHIARYSFNAAEGSLSERTPTASPPGSGPRHIAFHPNGKFAYVINEHASNVSMFSVASDGALTSLGTISTLPAGFTGSNTGAEIEVHPSGKFVYASNRGHDSIAVFAIGSDGKLTAKGHTPSGGTTPRHFSLILGGSALLAANQGNGTIFGFRVDATTGALTSVGLLAEVPGAQFVAARDL
jgi:6-phosphogluconolactonase